MPREQRIEYAGAIYHAMARGNRRGDIVLDDRDRSRFVETLEEVVESSGWVLYAWVLMSNHYHFLFQTPEPNLVQGMSWFQNTWTRRFNTRHRLWGHLFGGRYKAKPVEEGEYLSRLIAYVHLNPVRAGLVKRRDGLERRAQEELDIGDWTELKKGDWRKGLVAVLIRQRSLVNNGWLAERLAMGARTAVSRIMREAREHLKSNRKAKALGRRLEKQINQI